MSASRQFLAALALAGGLQGLAHAAVLDTVLIANGLTAPVYATSPVAGGPVFVVEKGGTIKAVQGGVVSSFLSLSVSSAGEQVLLGLAFDPGYDNPASPGYRRFFINSTDPVNQDTVIASYRTGANPLVADPASRVEVMRFDQPNGLSNHKAGWLGFKPGDSDHLYIASGDGGGSNDPGNNAQNNGVLLGKLLRIDINGDDFASPSINYAIPSDNPYAGVAGSRGEIFANGLRNPWRNSFDRLNGNLWIADVGQGAREEVNLLLASSAGGENFGWRVREGDIATPGVGGASQPGMVDPLLVYPRSVGSSITGGYVVRQVGSPLYGQYVFGDFINGRIWSVSADGSPQSIASATEWTSVLDAGAGGALGNIASFGEGALGELYIVDFGGKVVQVVPEPAPVLMLLAGLAGLAWRRRRATGQQPGGLAG
jgi:glucose/arabinose dehydrogenase